MKTKQVSLAILASMTLFACNNNDDLNVQGVDNAPKTVVMKLDGLSSSRSTDPTSTENKVSVHDIAVIFYANGGAIYQAEKITVGSADWTTITTTGKTYNDVDASVNKVMVIGNYGALSTNTEGAVPADVATLANTQASALLGKQLSLKSQNQSGTEKIDGTDGSTSTKAEITLFGTDDLERVGDNYEADVTIAPIVSRIEVTSVSCTFEDPIEGVGVEKTATVTVNGIGMFDYYNTMTLDGTNVTNYMADGDQILLPDDAEATTGQYKLFEASEDWGWAYDATSTGYNNVLKDESLTGNPIEMKTTASGKATFAYNFFPVQSTTTTDGTPSKLTDQVLANVVLSVKVEGDDEAATKDHFITTNFRYDGSVITPEPGKIYQFDYAVSTNNIRENEEWGQDGITATVKVTVATWGIVAVDPSF